MINTLHSNEFHLRNTKPAWLSVIKEDITDKNLLFISSDEPAIRNTYELDYAATIVKNIHEARNILVSALATQSALPDAIFCDTDSSEELIRHFAGYLSVNDELKLIPFILIAKNERHSACFNRILGVDDIISANTSAADLLEKIKVLRKFKTLKNKLPYQVTFPKKRNIQFEDVVRRIADITLSALLLVILSPVLLLIALAIKIDSKGSVLYVSPRAGRGFRVFKFYKFRTMIVDADKKIEQIKYLNQYKNSENAGPFFIKIDNDPRVTRVGRFLRNFSLDELPQLINVLKGDMSIVGNRPLPLYEACSLTIDEAAQRFLAPAGITGLWQIKKRGQPNMSAQERINLDIDYSNRHSLLYDMYILVNTPMGLIQRADV